MREITSIIILIIFAVVLGRAGWYENHEIRTGVIINSATIAKETVYTIRDENGHLYNFSAGAGDYKMGQSVKVTLNLNYTDNPIDDIVEKVI